MIKYKQQKLTDELIAKYGIKPYTKDQKKLHNDLMLLMKSVRHKKIGVDDCLIVFGRVYSIYVLSQIRQEELMKEELMLK
jgi:hypothetical protein